MRPELTQASELLRQNTPEAIEEAIGLLQNTIFSFSMKVCGHREDAEDNMQEVLFRSLKYLSKIENANALAAWLYTVTRNRCRRTRRNQISSGTKFLPLEELMPDDQELQRLLEAGPNPENEAISSEQHDLLQQAVLSIPSPLRMVLVLHDMEDLSSEEIARILDLQIGTVRVRLHRARLSARKEMNRILKGFPETTTQPGKAIAKRPSDCRQLFADLSDYLDNRLEPRTCEEMRKHIDACRPCIAFLNDLKAAIDRCRSLDVPCDPRVAGRMRAMMTREYLRLVGKPARVEKAHASNLG